MLAVAGGGSALDRGGGAGPTHIGVNRWAVARGGTSLDRGGVGDEAKWAETGRHAEKPGGARRGPMAHADLNRGKVSGGGGQDGHGCVSGG
jgi:hypothetical protein